MKTATHKAKIKQESAWSKVVIAKKLGLSEDKYEMLRYELAFEWLKKMDYLEVTAKRMAVSSSFFRWWYQRLHFKEMQFLNCNDRDILECFKEEVVNMNVKPSKAVFGLIRMESFLLFQKNPELKNLKVY